jgi:maltose alpha-D-glucosyltransferase/alpha-amylase
VIKDLWYKNAIVYCVHVGAYMDSNGDGSGDFEGLMRRLDYLSSLGATSGRSWTAIAMAPVTSRA